jgi:hypothetical protein
MSGLFHSGKGGVLGAALQVPTDNIKVVLVDFAQWTKAKAITGATNATPISITSTGHGLSTGDFVSQSGVGGNTAANGRFQVTNTGANTYTLQDPITGANVAGNGAYTSGGFGVGLVAGINANLSDIDAGARVATSGNLGSKTTSTPVGGVFDAADVTFTAVAAGAALQGIVGYKDSGVAGTSTLLWISDSATGLPVTPNGGDIIAQWDNGVNRIFNL